MNPVASTALAGAQVGVDDVGLRLRHTVVRWLNRIASMRAVCNEVNSSLDAPARRLLLIVAWNCGTATAARIAATITVTISSMSVNPAAAMRGANTRRRT